MNSGILKLDLSPDLFYHCTELFFLNTIGNTGNITKRGKLKTFVF